MNMNKNTNLNLINIDNMALRSSRKIITDKINSKSKKKVIKGKEYEEESLREYAHGVINERIKFCAEFKKDENLDKCVCEAMIRWLRLFDKGDKGKELGRLRVKMVEKVFVEMIKQGKLKCGDIKNEKTK